MNLTALQISHIVKLATKMKMEYDYEIIAVAVEDYSEAHQCFPNVEEKVKRDGGKIHYGWSVHFNKNLIIEAERHAVWEDENGDLICITPNPFGLDEVIFLSDDIPVADNLLIDNVRMNITNNPLVNDWIYFSNVVGNIWYSYRNRGKNGEMDIAPEVDRIIEKI